MLRIILLSFLLIFPLLAQARSTTQSNIAQQELVRFPQLGMVRVRAIEKLHQPFKLEFYSLQNKKVISTLMIGDSPFVSSISECLRFQVIPGDTSTPPLIFAVTASIGGSDGTFFGHLIGYRTDKFQVLNEKAFEAPIQGGFYVGKLEEKYGFGVAVWRFIWCNDEDEPEETKCGEAHYDNHRYRVTLNPLDISSLSFKSGIKFKSQNKYPGHGENALKEFGLNFADLRKRMNKIRKFAEY